MRMGLSFKNSEDQGIANLELKRRGYEEEEHWPGALRLQ